MLWFYLLLAFVLIAAGSSLLASMGTRRDLATGHPTFDSVADATGIWDVTHLDELIGPRDEDNRYTVGADMIRKIPTSTWKRWLDGDVADVGSIILSLVAAFMLGSNPTVAWVLIAISAAYIVIGYVGGTLVVLRNRP